MAIQGLLRLLGRVVPHQRLQRNTPAPRRSRARCPRGKTAGHTSANVLLPDLKHLLLIPH
jgi:hypothetical protein